MANNCHMLIIKLRFKKERTHGTRCKMKNWWSTLPWSCYDKVFINLWGHVLLSCATFQPCEVDCTIPSAFHSLVLKSMAASENKHVDIWACALLLCRTWSGVVQHSTRDSGRTSSAARILLDNRGWEVKPSLCKYHWTMPDFYVVVEVPIHYM